MFYEDKKLTFVRGKTPLFDLDIILDNTLEVILWPYLFSRNYSIMHAVLDKKNIEPFKIASFDKNQFKAFF